MTEPRDHMLVRAVLAGDSDAYGLLYDRYARLIRAICYDATGSLSDAQDLAQDVFLRAYQKLDQLRDPQLFGSWLVAIARLRSREWHRRRLRRQARLAQFNDTEPSVERPDDDGRLEQLRAKIATLPAKERLALHVFYLQEKSADDGCRIMGLSKSGFYRVLSRARQRLQRSLVSQQESIR